MQFNDTVPDFGSKSPSENLVGLSNGTHAEKHASLSQMPWGRLTTCASAAGPQAGARTNLRSLERSRRVPPERDAAPLRPVGCMRGLGGAGTGRWPATLGLGANPGNQTAEPLRHGFGAREWPERVHTKGRAAHGVVADRQAPYRHASDRRPTEREATNGQSTQG